MSATPHREMDEWVASVERARELDASVGETFEKLVAEHINAESPG